MLVVCFCGSGLNSHLTCGSALHSDLAFFLGFFSSSVWSAMTFKKLALTKKVAASLVFKQQRGLRRQRHRRSSTSSLRSRSKKKAIHGGDTTTTSQVRFFFQKPPLLFSAFPNVICSTGVFRRRAPFFFESFSAMCADRLQLGGIFVTKFFLIANQFPFH